MYTPKLMLLIFNLILTIVSIIAIHHGLADNTATKLKPLEKATDLAYFAQISFYGGGLLLATTFLGFWGADAESRIALITYKILLCFIIVAHIVIVCYFTFQSSSIVEQIHNQLENWIEEYKNENTTIAKLDDVQTYLDCCEFNPQIANTTKEYPISCCRPEIRNTGGECDRAAAHNETCTTVASDYFHVRKTIYVSFLLRTIVPQAASVVFADMVVGKITLLINLMQGKLT